MNRINCKECENMACGNAGTGLTVVACNGYRKAKRITRYDHLIRKSPEEMARFLYTKTCEDGYPQFDSFADWLEWLKQEVDDGEY